ncbi:hypothetical protein [Zhenhengia yiwuensis]|uniref:hypothetical protein n=1 Tax=Zhenhengia yiwuensis TaxID=2763666 RepID=UPI002A7553C9|nr:hypothetical protein [Zhenhengia yiwuensis]MDY3368405.1 hypothetical protein [Zhenhengia yiwuensis]
MIDLSKNTELYKIKLEDGTVLKLKKPTQSMLVQMMEMSQTKEKDYEIVTKLFELLTRIFNRNTNDMAFTQKQIEEMLDLEIAMKIVQDYLNSTLKDLGK